MGDLLDVHANTAALYDKKIRLLIAHHLEQETHETLANERNDIENC
jgi:hypothetical protein